jgi:hypothetical protein
MVDQVGGRTVVEPVRPPGWGLIAALVLLALVLGLTVFLAAPPPSKPKDVATTEFSGDRAGDILRNLIGDGSPRPAGSPAHARTRDKIVAHLRWLGYTPEVQEAVGCGRTDCGRVQNIVARLEGREPGKAVLLMAHYDSVPAGPGAGDDLTGVAAILEIARVLKSGPPPRNPVLFLLDDAEELGLLGAEAFAKQHPAAGQVGVVVNLEARGSGGPSLMFETSGADAVPVAAFASGAGKPFTSSLFPTIYEFLPNDTDLSVFKRREVPGLNFAFIENPTHYHTRLDNLENASPATLQHHGDNALAAVRGLAEADLSRPLEGKAVFFDLFHATVVRWPAGLTPVLALLALVLIVVTVIRSFRRGQAARRGVIIGVLTALVAVIFLIMAGFALQALLAGAFPAPWASRPQAAKAAFWLLALAVTLGTGGLLLRKYRAPALWGGVWTLWSVLGLVLSFTLPGISYLFVVPALVAGVCGLLFGRAPAGWAVATIVPAVVAGVLWFSVLIMLYTGLGLQGLLVTSILLSLVFGTLIPLIPASGPLGRVWIPLAATAGLIIATVMAMLSPAFTPSSPRFVDLQHFSNADSGESRWVARTGPPLPPSLRKAGSFAPRPQPPYPWSPPFARAFVAPAPRLNAPPPSLTVVSDSVVDGKRHLRLRLTSPRGAMVGTVLVPVAANLESLSMDGQPVQRDRTNLGPRQRWQGFTFSNLPPQGSEWEVVLGSTQPMEWNVSDRSYGLPPFARDLLAARPDNAVAFTEGDVTIVSRKVRI